MSIEQKGRNNFEKKEKIDDIDIENAEKAIDEIEILFESLPEEKQNEITERLQRLSRIRQKGQEVREIAREARARIEERKMKSN